MAARYETREADLDADAVGACALWANNLHGMSAAAAAQKWQHGYRDSPHGLGAAVLLHCEGDPEPVGVIGLHPRRGFLGATEHAMANLADFAVQPAHRTLGPAVTLVRRAIAVAQGRFDVLYGLPNRHSTGAITRAGMRPVGALVRYAKPLRFRGRGDHGSPVTLGIVPTPLVDLVLALADGWRRLVQRHRVTLTPAAFDSPALETLWAQRPHHLLLGERSGAALRWRFAQTQGDAWQLLLATGQLGQPVGYVVWRQVQGTAEIGDLFCVQPDVVAAPLLLALTKHLRRTHAHAATFSFFGCPDLVKALGQAGYVARTAHRQVFTTPTAMALATVPQAWYITAFDEDAD